MKLLQAQLQQKNALLLIHGSSGCGKSHLARVIAKQMFCEVESLKTLDMARYQGRVVIDQLEEVANDCHAQEKLVHCVNRNRLVQQGQIVLFSETLPASWPIDQQLPDFISRINGLFQCAEIAEPDDSLLRQILLKLAADQHFTLPESVISYWLARMPRSYSAAQELIQLLDQITLARQAKVSLVTARQALEELQD